MNTLDLLAKEILDSKIKTTTREAYEYAKFLRSHTKSLHFCIVNKR